MVPSLRRLVIFCVLALIAYFGWRTYMYYFDSAAPTISVRGMCAGGYYSGDVTCTIGVRDEYKVDILNVWLDDQPIVPNLSVGARSFEKNILLQTKNMRDGEHALIIKTRDAAHNPHESQLRVDFIVDNAPLQAALARPQTEFKVLPGRILYVPVQLNKQVKRVTVNAFGKEFYAVPASVHSTLYECFVPVDCEQAARELPLEIFVEDGTGHTWSTHGAFSVLPTTFKKQTLHHIDSEDFAQELKLGKTEKELADILVDVTHKSPHAKLWAGPFLVPMDANRIGCEFGTQRMTKERGCYVHAALDLIGRLPKMAVWAPQDGVIVIKERFGVTGNTVVIDHGCGILSLLCHLDRFADLAVGDKIRRGNPIGVTGKTGYAAGDHLHWEMRVDNVRVDPMQWTKESL